MKYRGTRMRRGLAGTAAAAAAMAALTASGAPSALRPAPETDARTAVGTADRSAAPVNDDSYHTELPPLRAFDGGPHPTQGPAGGPTADPVRAESGIPATVLAAYRRAESAVAATDPSCRLPWQLLAAIGKVESGQARGGRVDARGTTLSPILGPVLDGIGFASIPDTDNGAYDGDRRWDRAVGPMQFIPSTWANWGQDGNGDGRRDPHNIHDAALAAGRYLCAGDRNLTVGADLDRAVLSYNHSEAYRLTVLAWFDFYRKGAYPVVDGSGTLPVSPGAGGRTPATTPVGGGGEQQGGGDIIIGPTPGGKPSPPPRPRPSTPERPVPTPSTGPSPDPSETPGPSPDPSDPPVPSPDPSPDPSPSDTPCPTPTPDPSPSGSPSEPAADEEPPASGEDPCSPTGG